MMVSKVSVVALVAILAVPILMGYAMNLSEQTITEYKNKGQAVDVTSLLENGDVYTTAKADIYKMNTDFSVKDVQTKPIYEETSTTTVTSLELYQSSLHYYYTGQYYYIPVRLMTTDFYVYAGPDHDITLVDLGNNGNTSLHTVTNVMAVHYRISDHVVDYVKVGGGAASFTIADVNDSWLYFRNEGTGVFDVYYSGSLTLLPPSFANPSPTTYVDIAAGFYFDDYNSNVRINLPQKCSSVLFTVNIDSITDSNYTVYYSTQMGPIAKFEKVTTGGDIKYYFNSGEIYHDPNRSDNTYQVLITIEYLRTQGTVSYFNIHSEARYVGSWPTYIGYSNYFMKYEYNTTATVYNLSDINKGFDYLGFYLSNPSAYHDRSPTTRLDDAVFSAFKVPAIINNTLEPASFRSNPSTKIGSVASYGDSIVFGGNTYNVGSDGNITIGQRQFSLRNMVFDSIPVSGGYDNRINGYVVSTTVNPSSITFNGIWRTNITVDGMDSTTSTGTEWTPGEFAWDGIDTNFLIIGLLAAIGVFIALGIAYRKTKAALGALLVVCGGAILLFFTML